VTAVIMVLLLQVVHAAVPSQAPAQVPAPTSPAPPASDAPPSLDDALGLQPETSKGDGTDHASELDRSLQGAKPRDLLASAMEDMRRSARLLDQQDTGLPTRRAQEEVVRKLDELIATAQRMQQQQQQQQSNQQGQQQQQQRNQGKQRGEQQGKDDPRENGQERGGRPQNAPSTAEGRDRRPDGDANAQEPPAALDPTTNDMQFDESSRPRGRSPGIA
jgi:hypothetical protein